MTTVVVHMILRRPQLHPTVRTPVLPLHSGEPSLSLHLEQTVLAIVVVHIQVTVYGHVLIEYSGIGGFSAIVNLGLDTTRGVKVAQGCN
ncbi:TPA: hypothetical protein EYN65_23880 [Candidatus Poribacteria bacterium]|nr:hypothetical protein [Candidatus Poribacteria bacterium]